MIRFLNRFKPWGSPAIFPVFIVAFFLYSGYCCFVTGRVRAADGPLTLTILHLNDTHSHLEPTKETLEMTVEGQKERVSLQVGGYPRLLTKIEEIRSKVPDTLLLHAGDAVQGSLYFAAFKGKADMDFMNLARYDAMTVGNHEFDRGPEFLAGLIGQAEFPILGANVDASADPFLKGKLLSYMVKEVAGEKVAVIGLVTADIGTSSSPGDKLSFRSPAATVKELLAGPDLSGLDKVIVLSHLGYSADLRLAREVAGIDVIIGGHSHTLLGDFSGLDLSPEGEYPTMTQDPDENPVCIAQAWSWGRLLGVLKVDFNQEGVVTSCQGEPVIVVGDQFEQRGPDGRYLAVDPEKKAAILSVIKKTPLVEVVPEDKTARIKLDSYTVEIDSFRKEIVARAPKDLHYSRYPGSSRTSDADLFYPGAWPVNQINADSVLWAARRSGSGRIHLAIINNGGVRDMIPAGEVSAGDLFDTNYFDNTLVLLDMTGAEILADLETGASGAARQADGSPGEGGSFPTLSGARFSVDLNNAPGQRITNIEIKNEEGRFEPLRPEAIYRVATQSFLAQGGNGYENMKNVRRFRKDIGELGYMALIEYARNIKILVEPEENSLISFRPQN